MLQIIKPIVHYSQFH